MLNHSMLKYTLLVSLGFCTLTSFAQEEKKEQTKEQTPTQDEVKGN